MSTKSRVKHVEGSTTSPNLLAEPGPSPETVPPAPPRPTLEERLADGKARRTQVPRSAHAAWQPPSDRPDPVALLEESSRPRLQHLIPIRYGRMLASPFNFLRGSPIIMAHDLAATPVSGIRVQACGDAHLMNFGLYASPERNLLFDVNDFDETLPGPWEWDIKRLAASSVVAGRTHGRRDKDCIEAARACARSYRKHMGTYSRMGFLDVWYSRVDAEAALSVLRRSARKGMSRQFQKSRRRTSLQALSKLATVSDGRLNIIEDPPLITHVPEEGHRESLRRFFRSYYGSLQDDRRTLLQRYRFVDFALKVVGVGSVGTRCFIALLDGCDNDDPLFLQLKEARASVLEPHAGPSRYHNHGQRVVNGQRLMQSASDIFLGWSSEGGSDCYVRQLRDMKGTAALEGMTGADLIDYAGLCGWVLARAHARSGDPAPIAAYLGKSPAFDNAIAAFATAYADQTEQDYKVFKAAVKSGRIPAETGV
jgi:uncharacterized protein (DUF2252 family)